MQIVLRRGVTMHPGTFTAVIAPEKTILAALNSNRDIQCFLFLFVSGNYSRLLSGISRTSGNFDVRRSFTADQLLAVLNEAAHTVIFVEHDRDLFEGAEWMFGPVASALCTTGREALVILYAPAMDRSFAALMREADRIIELLPPDDPTDRPAYRGSRSSRADGGRIHPAQKTLEVL